MMKMFTRFLSITIILLSLLVANLAEAQNITYVFNPPPDNGSYEPGQVVNICFTVNNDNLTAGNWLHGLVFDLGSSWDASSITNVTTPGLFWSYYPSVTAQGNGNFVWGPGFYYDSNGDGNPGNNWGSSNPPYPITFCFDITVGTVEPDGSYGCGGSGNPLNGGDISFGVQITGDGETGSWGPTYTPQPDVISEAIYLDCCDAEAGVSPGVITICENGTYNLFDLLGAPVDAGGAWVGPAGWTDPSGINGLGTFDPTVDPPGIYTYEVGGTDGCVSSSSITLEYTDLGNAGTAPDCSGTPSDLFVLFAGLPSPPALPLTGTWTDPDGNVMTGSTIDPNFPGTPGSMPGNYVYEYYDSNNCKVTVSFNVIFATGGAGGSPGSADVCTSDPCYSPFGSLLGSPSPGGNWIVFDGSGGYLDFIAEYNVCLDMETYVAGFPSMSGFNDGDQMVFTYILGAAPCSPSLIDVTVSLFNQVDPGLSATASICVTDPPLSLITLLGGTPDSGLIWECVSGCTGVIPDLLDPAAYGVTDLVLQYSGGLVGTSCNQLSILELTILPAFADAGVDNTITLCQNDIGIIKYDSLLGSPQTGGFWLDNLGNVSPGGFNPAINTPGTYVFTYNIASTCATDQSTLTIILDPTLNPGISGTLDICTNETNVPLSGGLTPPFDTPGTWTNASGTVVGNTVSGNAVTNNAVYTYTVGTPTCQESATVTINLITAPNAGVLTAIPQTYCDSDGIINLMTLFTTNPSTMPASGIAGWTFGGAPVSTVDPSLGSAVSGLYTYEIFDTGCGPASVSINITIEDTPSAGTDGTLVVCPTSTADIPLFTSLGGSPNATGTWTGPSGPHDGSFSPGDAVGVYTYTVASASGNCTDQSTVTVSFQVLPNPGTSTTITVCEYDPAFSLISLMGPGAVTGSWSNSSGGFGNSFTPGTHPAGVYTNTVGTAPCTASATLTIIVTPTPNAGTDATVSFCETIGNIDLTSNLGGTPAGGGSWTDGSGNTVVNPLNLNGLCGSSYVYTYTVVNGSCSASSTLTFDVICAPDAGPDGAITVCADGAPIDLIIGLPGPYDTPGTWTQQSTGLNVPNPSAVNPATLGTGDTFIYSTGSAPCAADQANVVVTVTPALSYQNLSASCTASQTTYIVTFDVLGGDGNYSVPVTDGSITGSSFTSVEIPVGTPFSFVISDGSSCNNITVSGASPNCSCPVTASFSSGNQTICVGSSATLGVSLNGTSTGDYTYFINGNGYTESIDGSSISVSPIVTTTYTFDSVTDGNCTGNTSGSVTITVNPLNDAGVDVTADYCGGGSALNLNTILSPTADVPGTWSTNPVVLNASNSGVYTYTVPATACPADVANYTLNIDEPLSVTAIQTPCEANQTEYTVTFTINGGSGNYSVSGAGVLSGNSFTSDFITMPGAYNFTVSDNVGPCPDINVTGNAPNCNCSVNASFSSVNQTICIGSSVDLGIIITGGTDPYNIGYTAGGTPLNVLNMYPGDVITVSPTVTTTYALTSAQDNNCVGSANGSVTITVEQLPNAGNDVSATYCGDGSNLVYAPAAGEPTGGTANPTSITLLPANSGVYTYTMAGNICPDDVANYTINIIEELDVANLTAVCSSNQLNYTVDFDIVGGTSPFTVVGPNGSNTLAPGVTTFSETLVFASNPTYSYTISDNGPCNDVVISETAPDCNCIAQGSITGTQSICLGSCADIVFNGIGDAPFNITVSASAGAAPNIPNPVNNGHIITVCPSVTTTYTLTAISDSYCQGVVSGTSVTVTVDSPVVISNVTEVCSNTAETYQVQFNYTGGVGPINFSPANTSGTSGVYLGPNINSGQGYGVTIMDSGACPNQTVSSTGFTCDCISDAGSISPAILEVCSGEDASVSTNGSETMDANDIIQYVLHDGNATTIGNIIGTSSTGTFTFNYGSMLPGAAYYIHALVGNSIGGNVYASGPCTAQSNGVQIVMNALPTAAISGSGTVCENEPVDLTIVFTGEGPWDFGYSVGGVDNNGIISTGNTYTLTSTQPGDYNLLAVSDNNCIGTVSGLAAIDNYETPTATLSGSPTVCEGSGDGPNVIFTGNGPWSFVYTIDGVQQDAVTTNFTSYTIPVEADGTYALVSVEGSYCSGTVSGAQAVTILAAPTASITGGGTVCAGDAATFDVNLSGTAPWSVQYTVDGVPQNGLTNITEGYSFESTVDGDYVLVSVTDANCTGEVLASQASLIVNPLPTADITSNKSEVCIGEEVQLGIDLEGVPPFNVTYVLNGDTITATNLYSDFMQTLSPVNPVTFEVLFVEDGSNPTCSAEPMDYTFIDAVTLPNAPVLSSDTICSYNGAVSVGVNAAPGLTYSWSPEKNLANPNVSRTQFQPTATGPYAKVFTYVLTATNGICSATDTMTVTVEPGPQARFDFTPDPVSTEDPTVFFKNKTIGRSEVIYFWEFDSLDTSHEFEPSYKFPDGINDSYTITLTAIDPVTGCFGVYSEILQVKPEMLIYVPNAFTPDGDGKNDLWGPSLTNVDGDDYKLTVYDRLGEIVFSTSDVKQKWNGSKMNDSYYVQPGIYVWMIETKNQVSLEEINMKGTVTVVR